MPSFKNIAARLVVLLAADVVIAGPCRPSLTSSSVSASAEAETSVVSTAATSSVAISSTTVTSSETSTETVSTGTTSATESSTTSATAPTTTSAAPATLPTIANAGFDDNEIGTPWALTGPAALSGPSSSLGFWKRSQPRVMVLQPGNSIAQEITGLRTDLAYRVRFYWVKFDTPQLTAGCKLTATFGGENLGEVATLPPGTARPTFEEYVSTVYQPSATSAELKIGFTCTAPDQENRYYLEDVSIEFAE